jgi:hypothetical protein
MSYQTMTELEQEIAASKAKLAELESAKKAMIRDRKTSSDTGQLAIFLHEKLCNWNHTDGCSWHYEIHRGVPDWSGHAHSKYWSIAAQLANKGYKCEDVENIVSIITE